MQFQSSFLHQGSPARIVFGPGSLLRLAEEADRLGVRKILILTTPEQREAAVPDLLAPVAAIFDAPTAAAGLFAFAQRVGTPTALTSLGFAEADIAKAVGIALSRPCWNPRPLTEAGLSALLSRAVRGDAPAS